MPFTFGSIAAMSDDSGSDTDDFVTSDRTVSFSGFAAGNGTLGFWLGLRPSFLRRSLSATSPSGPPTRTSGRSTTCRAIPLPNGEYSLIITNGTGRGEP